MLAAKEPTLKLGSPRRGRPRATTWGSVLAAALALAAALVLEFALPGPKTAPAEAGTLSVAGE